MEILKITSQNFNDEVINSDVPVLIDFWHHGVCHVR